MRADAALMPALIFSIVFFADADAVSMLLFSLMLRRFCRHGSAMLMLRVIATILLL